MNAIHGGKATHDTIDAQKMAVLLRGGMLPHASVYPAAMRTTRDLLRRRIHVMRTRAELRGPIHQPNRQDHLPDIGKKIADKANRDGVAERFAEPAVHKRIEVDLALMGHDDELRRDITTRSLRRTVPGMEAILSLVLLDDIHAIQRVPRVHEVVSSCRLVTCAKASAGKRYGTAGTQIGHASLTWAFSEAAVFFLRHTPPGQTWLVRLEQNHGTGKALTVLAPKLARAVYHLFTRDRACDMPHCLSRASGAERMSPVPNWPISGGAWSAGAVVPIALRRERCGAHRPWPLSPAR
jgi:hypothetical protein